MRRIYYISLFIIFLSSCQTYNYSDYYKPIRGTNEQIDLKTKISVNEINIDAPTQYTKIFPNLDSEVKKSVENDISRSFSNVVTANQDLNLKIDISAFEYKRKLYWVTFVPYLPLSGLNARKDYCKTEINVELTDSNNQLIKKYNTSKSLTKKMNMYNVTKYIDIRNKKNMSLFYVILEETVADVNKQLVEDKEIIEKNANSVNDNIPPQITITNPNVTRGFKPVLQKNQITITGKATDASGIFEILINGEPANIDAQGNFSKTVLLAVGDNSFTVKATDIKQNTATETFVIERQTGQNVVVNNQTNNSNNLQTGKYYALIIGNDDYQDNAINDLDEPINDATELYNVLTTEYTFEPQNVTFLKNATYVQMIEAFDNLSDKITENDNLLVFYAGHGWWDDDKELGYWLPTDAKQSNTAFWIRNSTIGDYMSSINSKHTLLIADACFSGSIFKTRSAFNDANQSINKLYEMPSRKAMTSGNLKEVPDQSVFLDYLVKKLDTNTEKYISADVLFVSFRQIVMNNSDTEPQYGTIQKAGDEGGEFIFIRKDK